MKLFIANCTAQDHDFNYRVPENVNMRMQQIPAGRQIQITGDLSTQDIEFILNQHRIYGLVADKDIDQTRTFVGLCYSIDKPVQTNKIQFAFGHNKNVLIERGKEIQKETAVAVNEQLNRGAEGLAQVGEVGIELREERKDGGAPEVNTEFSVLQPGQLAPKPSGRQRRAS